MKKTLLTVLFSFCLTATTAWVVPVTYVIDPLQTNVSWSISHDGFSYVQGKITRIMGRLVLDDELPETSTVKAIMTMDYTYTGIDNLDARLKTRDFFNINLFPEAVYTSNRVTVVDKLTRKYKIDGILEFNGFKKPVLLNVILNKNDVRSETQLKTVGFSGTASLQRTEFGLTFGLPNIGNDVQLNIQLEASASAEIDPSHQS